VASEPFRVVVADPPWAGARQLSLEGAAEPEHPVAITGEWLAGFIDGEGSIGIASHGDDYLQPRFRLNLRDDDGDLVRAIQRFLGVGHLFKKRVNPATKYGFIKGRDQTGLNVIGRDCMGLVHLFDMHPLRSKKRHEYPIWREAVIDYTANPSSRWVDPEIKRGRDGRMRALKQRLEACRAYRGPT